MIKLKCKMRFTSIVLFLVMVFTIFGVFQPIGVMAATANSEVPGGIFYDQNFEPYEDGPITNIPYWTGSPGPVNSNVDLIDYAGEQITPKRGDCKRRTLRVRDGDTSALATATFSYLPAKEVQYEWWMRYNSTYYSILQKLLSPSNVQIGSVKFEGTHGGLGNPMIRYTDPSGTHDICQYSANTWYLIRVTVNCYTQKYKVLIMDINYNVVGSITDVSFESTASFAQTVVFTEPTSSELGTAYYDDVRVYSAGNLLSFEDGFEAYNTGALGTTANESNGMWTCTSLNETIDSNVKYLGNKSAKITTNGSLEYLERLLNPQPVGSVEAWIRPSQSDAEAVIEGYEDSLKLFGAGFGSNGQFVYYSNGTLTNTGVSYNANTWYRVQVRYNGYNSGLSYDFYVFDTSGNEVVSVTNADYCSGDSSTSVISRSVNKVRAVVQSSTSKSIYIDEIKGSVSQSKARSNSNTFYAAKELQKLNYAETFEGYITGNLNGQDNWTVTENTSTSATIANTMSREGKQSLKLYDNSTTGKVDVKHPIGGDSNLKAEWWVRAEQTNADLFMYGSDSSNFNTVNFAISFRASGKVLFSNGSANYEAFNYSPGVWYRFRIFYDGDNDEYDLVVHDQDGNGIYQSTHNTEWVTSKTCLKWLNFFTNTASTGTFYIDDISSTRCGGYDSESIFQYLEEGLRNGTAWKDIDNESDNAWKVSRVMEAYLDMYEKTQNTNYLDDFITYADAQLNLRDNIRGVTDYNNNSRKLWGHKSFNSLSDLMLKDSSGNDTLNVKAVRVGLSDGYDNGGTAPYSWSQNVKLKVTTGSDPNKFNIEVFNPGVWWREYKNLDMSNVETVVNGTDYCIQVKMVGTNGRPVDMDYTNLVPKRMALQVDNGLIASTYARYLYMVKSSILKSNTTYNSKADTYKTAIEDLIAEFDNNFVYLSGSEPEGYYINPTGMPIWSDGQELPFNRMLSPGVALIWMHRAYDADNTIGDAAKYNEYENKAKAMARHFKNDLTLVSDATGEWYSFHYYDVNSTVYNGWTAGSDIGCNNTKSYTGFRDIEDPGHSTIDTAFTVLAYEMNWNIINQTDIDRLINTYKNHTLNDDLTAHAYIDGTEPAGYAPYFSNPLYGMIWLTKYDQDPTHTLYNKCKDILDTYCLVPNENMILDTTKLLLYKP